jgi:hypothetical protein
VLRDVGHREQSAEAAVESDQVGEGGGGRAGASQAGVSDPRSASCGGAPSFPPPELGNNRVTKSLVFSANAWDGWTEAGSDSVIISDGCEWFTLSLARGMGPRLARTMGPVTGIEAPTKLMPQIFDRVEPGGPRVAGGLVLAGLIAVAARRKRA